MRRGRHYEGTFARRVPGAPAIQMNVLAIDHNALPPNITPSSSPGTLSTTHCMTVGDRLNSHFSPNKLDDHMHPTSPCRPHHGHPTSKAKNPPLVRDGPLKWPHRRVGLLHPNLRGHTKAWENFARRANIRWRLWPLGGGGGGAVGGMGIGGGGGLGLHLGTAGYPPEPRDCHPRHCGTARGANPMVLRVSVATGQQGTVRRWRALHGTGHLPQGEGGGGLPCNAARGRMVVTTTREAGGPVGRSVRQLS